MKRLALLITPLLLGACAQDVLNTEPEVKIDPDSAKKQSNNAVQVQNPADYSALDLSPGGTLTVRLDANPSTGLWWSDPQFDTAILAHQSTEYVADPAPAGIVGSGGTTVMQFTAIAPGSTRIHSEYSRGGGEVYETLDITVEVTQ